MSVRSKVYGATSRYDHISAALHLDLDEKTVPAPLEARRRPRRRVTQDPKVGHPFEPLGHHDRDFEPGQVHAETEMLSAAESQEALDRSIPDERVGIGVLALIAVGRTEQRDDALTRLDGGVTNGERFADGAGEPLGGCAVADHLFPHL